MKKLIVILFLLCVFVPSQTVLFAQEKSKTTSTTKKKVSAKKKTGSVKPSPSSSKTKSTTHQTGVPDEDPAVGKTASGKIVFEGDRGGHYYLTENSNRIYVQEFIGAKIIGKTKDGKHNIYEGPRGGHFYYNTNGDKVYIKR